MMRKRIFGILISCLLLLALMPAALAADGELPDLSKEAWATHEGHESWTALSTLSGTTITLQGGSYYLDDDMALKSVTIEGDVTLCLNGNTLCWEGASTNADLITVEPGATLHLCDCAGERGAIAGENYGGALIAVSGRLEMYQVDLSCGARLYAEGLNSAAGSVCVVQDCSISQTGYDEYSSDGVKNSGEMTLIDTQVSGFGVCVTNYKGDLTMSGCRMTAPQFCALVNSRGTNIDDLSPASAELTDCVLEQGSLGNYVAVYNGGDIHSSAVQLNAYAGSLTLTDCTFEGLESSNVYRSGRHELDPKTVVVSISGGRSSGNISNQGQMTIRGCEISGMVRNIDSYFGGNSLYPAADFRLVMEGCTVSVDDDTAVEVSGGAAQLTGCVLSAVCTEPNFAYTVSVRDASATLKNCTVSMDASQVTQWDNYEIQALAVGYPFSGVNVYTDGAVELIGGSIEAKGPFACGLMTSLLEGAEMSVTGTEMTAPVGVSVRGATERTYYYYYIDGEYSDEESAPLVAAGAALVLDGVEIEAEKYGVECGGGVTITGSSIHGGEAGLYREGVACLTIIKQTDTPYGDIDILLLESDIINIGGQVSISDSRLSGGSFAAYQAGARCVDYTDLASGGSGSFDAAPYPELERDLQAAVGQVMLGSGVTLEGAVQLGSSVLSGISAQDENGVSYDGAALSVRYDGTPVEGDPIIDNVTAQTQGLFTLKYPQDWMLIPSADGSQLVLHYSPTVYYKISASAGEGGTVSPSGEVSVEEGADQTFTFAPEDGWRVASVQVDGRYVKWSGNSYTFSGVTADHSLLVSFERAGGGVPVPVPDPGAQFVIEASAGDGGSISPEGRVLVPAGGSETFTLVPGEGYRLAYVLVDGVNVGAVSSYTFKNVNEDHSIEAVFAPAGSGVSAWLDTSEHMAYLSGYEDGSFAPDSGMTRAEAAQMFYNLLLDKNVPVTAAFSDVPTDAWYADAVNALASLGILQGVEEGVFAPARPITRAEFAAIAMRFADVRPAGQNIFSDVSAGDWFYGDVSSAAALGWINGYEDGSFRPGSSITRAEVTAVVNRMLGRSADKLFIDLNAASLRLFTDVAPGHWAYYQIAEAANAHGYSLSGGAESWTGLK